MDACCNCSIPTYLLFLDKCRNDFVPSSKLLELCNSDTIESKTDSDLTDRLDGLHNYEEIHLGRLVKYLLGNELLFCSFMFIVNLNTVTLFTSETCQTTF